MKHVSFFFLNIRFLYNIYNTGLPTKDETVETTVQNLTCLLYIHPNIYIYI